MSLLKYGKFEREMSAEEIQYYKDVEDFAISDYIEDEKRDREIVSMALGDIMDGSKKRERGDFKNDLEYDHYRAVLYDAATRVENGFNLWDW